VADFVSASVTTALTPTMTTNATTMPIRIFQPRPISSLP